MGCQGSKAFVAEPGGASDRATPDGSGKLPPAASAGLGNSSSTASAAGPASPARAGQQGRVAWTSCDSLRSQASSLGSCRAGAEGGNLPGASDKGLGHSHGSGGGRPSAASHSSASRVSEGTRAATQAASRPGAVGASPGGSAGHGSGAAAGSSEKSASLGLNAVPSSGGKSPAAATSAASAQQQRAPVDAGGSACAGAASDGAAAAAAADGGQWVLRPTPPLDRVYDVGKVLGQGSFGVVRLATHKTSGCRCACKTISKALLASKDVAGLRHEVEILHHLAGHPNISQLVDVFEDASSLHLIVELCEGGDLFDAIIAAGRHSERAAADVLRAVLTAIGYCHAMGVCHRDIKPENFMLAQPPPSKAAQLEAARASEARRSSGDRSSSGGGGGSDASSVGENLKLIDYGLSTFCSATHEMSEVVGTSYYVAPEVLLRKYGRGCDVWSAGVILHILLTGYAPFDGRDDEEILWNVRTKQLDLTTDPLWKSLSNGALHVLRSMLDRDPKNRATAEQLLAMPWLGRDAGSCTASRRPLPGVVTERLQKFAAMNSFKKVARKVVAGLMSQEQVAGLVAQFQMLDADGDGCLTLQELRAAMAKQQKGGLGGRLKDIDVRAVMERADLNGDGVLDASEFLGAALPAAAIVRQNTITLHAAFAAFDTDGSGFITADELRVALQGRHNSEDIDRLIIELDSDSDGRINYQEFCAMLAKDDDLEQEQERARLHLQQQPHHHHGQHGGKGKGLGLGPAAASAAPGIGGSGATAPRLIKTAADVTARGTSPAAAAGGGAVGAIGGGGVDSTPSWSQVLEVDPSGSSISGRASPLGVSLVPANAARPSPLVAAAGARGPAIAVRPGGASGAAGRATTPPHSPAPRAATGAASAGDGAGPAAHEASSSSINNSRLDVVPPVPLQELLPRPAILRPAAAAAAAGGATAKADRLRPVQLQLHNQGSASGPSSPTRALLSPNARQQQQQQPHHQSQGGTPYDQHQHFTAPGSPHYNPPAASAVPPASPGRARAEAAAAAAVPARASAYAAAAVAPASPGRPSPLCVRRAAVEVEEEAQQLVSPAATRSVPLTPTAPRARGGAAAAAAAHAAVPGMCPVGPAPASASVFVRHRRQSTGNPSIPLDGALERGAGAGESAAAAGQGGRRDRRSSALTSTPGQHPGVELLGGSTQGDAAAEGRRPADACWGGPIDEGDEEEEDQGPLPPGMADVYTAPALPAAQRASPGASGGGKHSPAAAAGKGAGGRWYNGKGDDNVRRGAAAADVLSAPLPTVGGAAVRPAGSRVGAWGVAGGLQLLEDAQPPPFWTSANDRNSVPE